MCYRVLGIPRTHTKLLLHADGTHNSTVFTDEVGHVMAAYGNTRIVTNQSVFGGTCAYLDGSGDYLSTTNCSDWTFGTNDFTIELRVRFAVLPGIVTLIGSHDAASTGGWAIVNNTTPANSLQFHALTGMKMDSRITVSANRWYHVAVTRASGIGYLFVDGRLLSCVTLTNNLSSPWRLTLGATTDGLQYLSGYLDEVRILKGYAKWTGDFVVPQKANRY